MTIFRNIGPGVGVRILGLAVLKFFLLAYGGCPFKGLLPMSSPREHEGGFHYLLALSSIYCLQTLRMPMLSDGIWLLVVILIGIIPVIISDAEHLVLWPSGFFLSLKDVRKIDLWNWVFESQLCLEFISAIPSQDLSWGQLSLTAFWIGGASQHWWASCYYRMFPQGGSTSSCPTLVPPATRALGKVQSCAVI